ncbi:hypothetical protein BDZ45DRAFT_728040 [Acephala macrosclerotiorum]|nr:hypothetical protein BDZ45DRAFT_728040 [Acephala macrosclerotiorum]
MPIRKIVRKSGGEPQNDKPNKTGEYSSSFGLPQPYKPIQKPAPTTASYAISGLPASSTRDLNYFFTLAESLYREKVGNASNAPASTIDPNAPPSYNDDFQDMSMDLSAVLVIWLFRQTMTHVFPITERFHLGPADRQPLYSVTAQPSIRSAQEFNELAIKRRDPVKGTWYSVCTSDIEPSLDLVKPGSWRVSKLVMESIPVWKKVLSGQVVSKVAHNAQGNTLRLSWGDRSTLGQLGDAYGLWWESGSDHGIAEAFYVVEGWRGFDSNAQGLIKVKVPVLDAKGKYQDPHLTQDNLAVVYFHADGKTPPQFVSHDPHAQLRLDIIMSGLMTVLVIETRKAAVVKELGSLPAYGSSSHVNSKLVEEGPMCEDIME